MSEDWVADFAKVPNERYVPSHMWRSIRPDTISMTRRVCDNVCMNGGPLGITTTLQETTWTPSVSSRARLRSCRS